MNEFKIRLKENKKKNDVLMMKKAIKFASYS